MIENNAATAVLAEYTPDEPADAQEPAADTSTEPADAQETERIDLSGYLGADETAILELANTTSGYWYDYGMYVVTSNDYSTVLCALNLDRGEDGKVFCDYVFVYNASFSYGEFGPGMLLNELEAITT